MKKGEVIDYIEHQKIICAVILKTDIKKIKVLVESGREIKLSEDRVFYKGKTNLSLSASKPQLLESIKLISTRRIKIASNINVKRLWDKINKNSKWFKVKTIAKLLFPNEPSENEEAAVVRALFNDKIYFRFKPVQFYPQTKKEVDKLSFKIKKVEHYDNLIEIGQKLIKDIEQPSTLQCIKNNSELVKILCSFYMFGKKSPYSDTANKILDPSEINSKLDLFNFLVKIGIWDINENIDVFRFKIPTMFSHEVTEQANKINANDHKINFSERVDLTNKFTITIDGIDTLDFDDALSIEQEKDNYLVGIHISDVAHYIKMNDIIDTEARSRMSSIYMLDKKIPMIPSVLSEDTLSLKKNKIRPAISTMVKLNSKGLIVDYNIYCSIISVNEHLNYNTADTHLKYCKKIKLLYNVARNLRKRRIQNGATQIALPEVNIIFKKSRILKPDIEIIDKESSSHMIVSEIMILSNWVTAQFLKKNKISAIFRSQSEPISRLIKNNPDSIFHNWMQKKMFRKLYLSNNPKRHCVLGLNAYTTATSPIRKYSDLVTQRQIRRAMKIDKGYTNDEITLIIKNLTPNIATISKLQVSRNRYWLLKYLENKIGNQERAIVLQKKKKFLQCAYKKIHD